MNPRDARDAGRRAGSRPCGAGADQRDAADAAARGGAARATLGAWRPPDAARQPRSLHAGGPRGGARCRTAGRSRWTGCAGCRRTASRSRSPGGISATRTKRSARAGYARLFAEQGIAIDATDPARLVLFPEMDAAADVAEITTACWGILGKSPGRRDVRDEPDGRAPQRRARAARRRLHADPLRSRLRHGRHAGRGARVRCRSTTRIARASACSAARAVRPRWRSTRPATASSLASIAGSRASGAVMSA